MSYSLDLNILLCSSNQKSPCYKLAEAFLGKCRTSSEPLCLAWPTLMGYLRISTHSGVFDVPLSPDEA